MEATLCHLEIVAERKEGRDSRNKSRSHHAQKRPRKATVPEFRISSEARRPDFSGMRGEIIAFFGKNDCSGSQKIDVHAEKLGKLFPSEDDSL